MSAWSRQLSYREWGRDKEKCGIARDSTNERVHDSAEIISTFEFGKLTEIETELEVLKHSDIDL